jgi:hypothetical protein
VAEGFKVRIVFPSQGDSSEKLGLNDMEASYEIFGFSWLPSFSDSNGSFLF